MSAANPTDAEVRAVVQAVPGLSSVSDDVVDAMHEVVKPLVSLAAFATRSLQARARLTAHYLIRGGFGDATVASMAAGVGGITSARTKTLALSYADLTAGLDLSVSDRDLATTAQGRLYMALRAVNTRTGPACLGA